MLKETKLNVNIKQKQRWTLKKKQSWMLKENEIER